MTMKRCARTSTACAVLLVLAGCAKNPATGERQLSFISEAQEVEIGRQAAEEARQSIGLIDDPQLQAYVARVGTDLAKRSERPDLPWSFQAVDDPSPNAFALPGGFIFVTRGMLNLMTSEAELASVLGHEIAHVTARHSVNQISKQQLAQIGLGLGGVFFPSVQELSPAIGTGLGLLFLKYGRDDEREADELGFSYAKSANYDVSEFADVFQALGRMGGEQEGALPNWLSSHPTSQERVETARARAAQLPDSAKARVGSDAYLQQIDGLVYGTNPRQGFFRDNTFYHPELQFQIEFPGGWQTQNMTQAVVAAAPDGAAVMELTMVPGGSAEAALQQFAQQSGLQFGSPRRQNVSGLDAVSAEFVADTQQGRLRGVTLFVEHRDRVYQLMGYGAAARFDAYANAMSSSLASFGPVRDASVLSVQPNRMEVVRVDRTQTLGEFAKRFKSPIPVEELAILNHLPDASARLEPGMLVKRVTA